jgi:hypothetical protein
MPAPPPGSPGLFRCASPGYMRAVFAEAGLRDIVEEEVSCDMVIDTPERYWEIMTDIAAPVVAGLAKADEVARERIRAEVLGLASQFLREGAIRMPSAATVVVGMR